jgi:hypothetical protein
MGKGKGIVVRYEVVPDFDMESESKEAGNSNGEIRRNNKFELKVRAPLMNKPKQKVVLGFTHSFEEFNFNRTPTPTYDLYENLEDRNLKTIGGELIFLRTLNEENYMLFRGKGELRGDYTARTLTFSEYLKTNFEAIYGWKKSPMFSWGIALQYGYTFGRASLYPAIMYNRTFNDKWGIEAIIPANVKLRYNQSERSLWFLGYKLEGNAYTINIDRPPFSNYKSIELRNNEIRAQLRWEREIYDFLWFGIEGGYRHNVKFDVYPGLNSKEDPIIETDLGGAPFIAFEIFLVPPRRFLKN